MRDLAIKLGHKLTAGGKAENTGQEAAVVSCKGLENQSLFYLTSIKQHVNVTAGQLFFGSISLEGPMNIKELRELIRLVEESSIQELEIEDGKKKIRILKTSPSIFQKPIAGETVMAKPSTQEKLKEIKSPIVGTFHLMPEDGASPYVVVGSEVKAGETIIARY